MKKNKRNNILLLSLTPEQKYQLTDGLKDRVMKLGFRHVINNGDLMTLRVYGAADASIDDVVYQIRTHWAEVANIDIMGYSISLKPDHITIKLRRLER